MQCIVGCVCCASPAAAHQLGCGCLTGAASICRSSRDCAAHCRMHQLLQNMSLPWLCVNMYAQGCSCCAEAPGRPHLCGQAPCSVACAAWLCCLGFLGNSCRRPADRESTPPSSGSCMMSDFSSDWRWCAAQL
ncbi:hypothetical protein COO60DRAFT_477913 [Scenedesmus sp. NREL 46B-D3]|nr:hypothetical protein COO60DRAFT_477913 [Scenedesmus sp. NREL 46B-D3]